MTRSTNEIDEIPPPTSSLVDEQSTGAGAKLAVVVMAIVASVLLLVIAMAARNFGGKTEKKKGVVFVPDEIASGYLPASPTAPVKPQFPEGVGGSMYEGEVTLGVTVSPKGAVEEVVVVKGLQSILDAIAVKSARKATFHPGRRDGKPTRSKILVKVPFEAF